MTNENEFNETIETEKFFVGMLLGDIDTAASLDQYPDKKWFLSRDMAKISEAIEKASTVDAFEISSMTGISQSEIVRLQLDAPISHNPSAYAKEIFNNFKGRTILDLARKWSKATKYTKEFFDGVETDLCSLSQITRGIHDVVFTHELLDDWVADKERRIAGEIKPVLSGFPSLDEMLAGGFHRGDLITVAGRPGSGKSGLLKSSYLNMVKNDENLKVAIFSIEMSPNEYIDRMCAEYTRISGTKLRKAVDLTDHDLDMIMGFAKKFHAQTFSFNKIQQCTVYEIARLAKAAKLRMGGLDAIFVDHLHIIKSHDKRLMEQDRLAEQTITLKRMAQDLDVPVILAAQCNREQEKRPDKTPQMSDLRGSGAIEQDSNCILFVHRPGLYDQAVDPGIAEVALRKNRHGPSPALLTFKFEPEFTAFVEMA